MLLCNRHENSVTIVDVMTTDKTCGVALLGLALCVWLIASAVHTHVEDDEPTSSEPTTECIYCLALPAGAPAPAYTPTAQLIFTVSETVAEVSTVFVPADVWFFYLSRGPPAL